jgi:predicted secreted hydrolase
MIASKDDGGSFFRRCYLQFALTLILSVFVKKAEPSMPHPPKASLHGTGSRILCVGNAAVFLLILFSAVLVMGFPTLAQEAQYYAVTGPCNIEFPKDHGAHPGYQTEWWYYTGNLRSEKGDRYGFQLTLFRRQISPPGADRMWPSPASAWRSQQIFLAHAALTDIAGKRFHHAEQASRGMPALAGVHQENGSTSIFLKSWSVNTDGNEHFIKADAEDFTLDLKLSSRKPAVLHGEAGFSRKGVNAERASCYYSFTRLYAEGSISLNGTSITVKGAAWMDHEFSSAALESNIEGWDWLSLQFSNNTELMIYLLRKKDGTYSEASSGTFVDTVGQVLHIHHDEIGVEVLDHWKSPRNAAAYPSSWLLKVQPLQMELFIRPNLQDQELQTPESTRISYWEGSVLATGSSAGQGITGEGYVELTGYAGAINERF